VRAGEKRKSGVGEDEAAVVKKRRKEGGLEARDNVVFIPFGERVAPLPPKGRGEGEFALLPDWRERFPEGIEEGSPTRKRMPADMRKAAEAEDEEDDEEERDGEEPTAGENEMDVDSEDYEDEDEDDAGAGPDQDIIMQVLRQKLADSGLGDVDESVFKDAIAKMLSGEGDSEDALGGLTSLLLGQKDGGGKAFEGFLAGQGVDINREEDAEEDADENEEEDGQEKGESHIAAQNTGSAATPKKTTRSKTASASTSTPNHRTPATRGKSKPTTSSTTTTTATNTQPKSKPASPIVVPSPPPLSFKTSRKRRAPSLDEPALPQPEAPSNSAKPAAKRRRAPRTEPPPTEPETAPSVVSATGRHTTRSAAAAGKSGR
jgi:hypothetical protein